MTDRTTWVLLGDGTYFRILVNKVAGNKLVTLRTDDFEHSSNITNELITGKRHGSTDSSEQTEKRSYTDLLVTFLTEQHEKQSFDQLVIAAPEEIIKTLRRALPRHVNELIVGEVSKDLLAYSVDKIERIFGDLIIET